MYSSFWEFAAQEAQPWAEGLKTGHAEGSMPVRWWWFGTWAQPSCRRGTAGGKPEPGWDEDSALLLALNVLHLFQFIWDLVGTAAQCLVSS